MGLETPRV
ncbi:hypothetical protein VCHC55B2_3396A, partial [Vibrio cholerae HC-55B2]